MKTWFLFEKTSHKQIEDLSFHSLLERLKTHSSAELGTWYAWSEGFDDWKKVLEIPEIKAELESKPVKRNSSSPPPFKVPAKVIAKAPPQKPNSGGDNRKHERFDLKLRVIMRSNEVTFRTFTKNLSAGGVALEHEVPAHLLNKECHMYISDPESQSNIKFKATMVPNRNEAKFFLFTDLEDSDRNKFEIWLKTFINKLARKSA